MRILVLRPGALGDVVLTLPALDALQARFPPASIEWMGNLAVLSLLPGRSVVDTVSSFDRADLAALFQADAAPPATVLGYLQAFDLILSYATPAKHVFALNLTRIAPGRVLHFDPSPLPQQRMHMSDYLQQPLRELGIATTAGVPHLALTARDRADASRWWMERGLDPQQVAAIHPGSGSAAKNWPAERFVQMAARLAQEQGVHTLWVSGPADAGVVAQVQDALGASDSLWLQDSPLPLLAAILARCKICVGNDSGVSHLAAAVGAPTVAIFGPTDPRVWAPRGRCVRVLRGSAACAPCTLEERGQCRRRVCLDAVSVESVLEAVRTLAWNRLGA